MLCLKRHFVVRPINFRCLSTSPDAKKENALEAEWEAALPYNRIPGPNLFEIIRNFMRKGKWSGLDLIGVFRVFRDEYGPIVRVPGTLGRRDAVFSFDPKDYERVYRTEGQWPLRRGGFETLAHYRKHERPDVFKNVGGLVTDQGESWAAMRFKVNPVMLQPKTVKTYIPQVDAISKEFVEQIYMSRDAAYELPATFGQELNKWALESIGFIALDRRLGALDADSLVGKEMIKNMKEFLKLSYQLDMQPSVWRYYKTPPFKRLMQVFDNITNIITVIVDESIEELNKQPANYSRDREASVLEKLLKIDRQIAVVMAFDMLVGGVDTTATTVAGCLYHLATNPEKQEKLRQEIRQILPTTDTKLSPESLNRIPYLRACLKEALRLSPVLSGLVRATGQNIVLQGYQVPKGIDVVIAGTLLQKEDAHFPQSAEFIPERWIKNVETAISTGCPMAKTANPFIYLPFGFGPRACIGRRFAEMEVQILLTHILRRFKVEWNYTPIKYNLGLIQTVADDLKFKLTELDI